MEIHIFFKAIRICNVLEVVKKLIDDKIDIIENTIIIKCQVWMHLIQKKHNKELGSTGSRAVTCSAVCRNNSHKGGKNEHFSKI